MRELNPKLRLFLDFLMLTMGAAIAAFAIEEFLVPCTILDGGVIGIGIMVNNLTHIPLSILTIVLNIPFLLIGSRKLGVTFIVKSGYAMAMFSIFLEVFAPWVNATDQYLLAVCFGGVTNKGTIESGTFAGSFNNSGANAVVKSGVFTNYANFGAQNPSTTWVNVKNGTLNNVITGMARIVGEQEVTVTAKVSPFKGWVYSGDISDAVAKQIEEQKNNETMTLTLNGDDLDSINLTAKTDGESFGITMLDGKASVDGTDVSAAVPGQTVTITMDDSEIPEGMSFDHWVIGSDVELEGGFKATDRTTSFKMPEQELTIYASLRTDSDDGTDAMTIVAGVAIGAGAAVLTYHIGTELYAKQVLGDGVAIPRTREEVALKAWELAGKPAVELNGEPLSEAAQAEKWAVESGLMQNVDGSFNGSKKMSKLKALRVLDAAKKLG